MCTSTVLHKLRMFWIVENSVMTKRTPGQMVAGLRTSGWPCRSDAKSSGRIPQKQCLHNLRGWSSFFAANASHQKSLGCLEACLAIGQGFHDGQTVLHSTICKAHISWVSSSETRPRGTGQDSQAEGKTKSWQRGSQPWTAGSKEAQHAQDERPLEGKKQGARHNQW